jgi:AraC family transcriptional regulator, transcriptional activator of pobA
MLTVRRGRGATPVHTAVPVPGSPPIAVMRIDTEHAGHVAPGSHSHDFPTLAYFEHGDAAAVADGRPVSAGDLYVIAPGDVLTIGDPAALAAAGGWSVNFLPEAVDDAVPGALLSWRAHPLLSTFARDGARGALRLSVPPAERAAWTARVHALDAELRGRGEGFREAALAHLVLLLVGTARLARDTAGRLHGGGEPLLEQAFAVIERRYHEPLSLREVARAVNLSPGHLTTTVRERTGRTVGEWILERRMAQARRLLAGSARSVEEIARAVGMPDPSYFARRFRRVHGLSPLAWRRAERAARGQGAAGGRSRS